VAFDRPHLAFPVARGSYVEQGTPEHDLSRCQVVIACPAGFRTERPEFGWPMPMFHHVPLATDALAYALRTYANVDVVDVTEYEDAASQAIRHMTVEIGEEPSSE
jgi:hypothetical protein